MVKQTITNKIQSLALERQIVEEVFQNVFEIIANGLCDSSLYTAGSKELYFARNRIILKLTKKLSEVVETNY